MVQISLRKLRFKKKHRTIPCTNKTEPTTHLIFNKVTRVLLLNCIKTTSMRKLLLNTLFILFICNINSQNWGEQILNQPNIDTNSFGFSVDIDGDYAVIGAPGENERTGSAHVYKKDANGTWNHHQKIEAYIGKHDDEYFGWVVAIKGDYIFVTAQTDRINEVKFEQPAGSVMIYKKDINNVWNGVQRLRSSDIRYGDYFGSDIAVDGDYLVIGAKQQDYDATNGNQETSAGAAYIFKKDINGVWIETQKITPSHRDYSDNIGESVSIAGDYIVLASKNDTDEANANPLNGNGSVFVFKKDAGDIWSQVQKLKPSAGFSNSHFGFGDVSISENYLAVGAKNVSQLDNNVWYNGYVYIFKKDANDVWNQSQIVRASGSSKFGTGISLDDNLLLVSAPESRVRENGVNIQGVGLSYLFVKNEDDEFVLAETIQASEITANSTIGTGNYNATTSTYAVALSDDHFILGAANTKRTVGNTDYFNAGTAYISGNINDLGLLNVLSVENNLLTSVSLYPNPVKNKLNIQLSQNQEKIKVSIYNVLGKNLLKKEFQNSSNLEIDFNFPKGIYLSKITLKNNTTITIKLIKN
jgi:hypothetical protein